MPRPLHISLLIDDASYCDAIVLGLSSGSSEATEIWLTIVKPGAPYKPSYSRNHFDVVVYQTPNTTSFRLWQIWHQPYRLQHHDYTSVAELVAALKYIIAQRTSKQEPQVYYEYIHQPIDSIDIQKSYAHNPHTLIGRRP